MKKLVSMTLLAMFGVSAMADGHHHGSSSPASVSVSIGGSPYAYPYYYPPGSAYPYVYSPGYDYACTRPNYAMGGAMMGAMMGGIIGSSDHRGWEGAGIGAAAGLFFGSIAELSTRSRERAVFQAQAAPAPVVYQNAPEAPFAPAPEPAPAWNPPITTTNATYYWAAPPAPEVQKPATSTPPAGQPDGTNNPSGK